MKNKFIKAVVGFVVFITVFAVTMLNPTLFSFKTTDFLQGFSGGISLGSFVAAIYYFIEMKKQQKADAV